MELDLCGLSLLEWNPGAKTKLFLAFIRGR